MKKGRKLKMKMGKEDEKIKKRFVGGRQVQGWRIEILGENWQRSWQKIDMI
jgi:hypothetical protein